MFVPVLIMLRQGVEEPAIRAMALVQRADPALADELAARLAAMRAALRGEGAVRHAAAALASSPGKLPAAPGIS